jgi:hypothetical protein
MIRHNDINQAEGLPLGVISNSSYRNISITSSRA